MSANHHDIFLSYAHVDNSSGNKAIDSFVKELESKVNQQIGRESEQRIWKDNKIDGNQQFSDKIKQQLKQSHCLLLFLSPAYLASEWCQDELEFFHQYNEQYPERIFSIELDAVPIEKKPKILKKKLGYHFWSKDSLSKETYPLRFDHQDYENTLLKLAKDLAKQIKLAKDLKQQLYQASAEKAAHNKAYPEAIKQWELVKEINPLNTKATEEIGILQQQVQQQDQAKTLLVQLIGRMEEINIIFPAVSEVLGNSGNHPKAQLIIEKTKQFLQDELTADEYIHYCQQQLSNTSPLPIVTEMDHLALAKRICKGRTVLFLGAGIPSEYGEPITDASALASHLADHINYPDFQGSFSEMAEYYQLRPEYGQDELLSKVSETLFSNAPVISFYQHLARIQQALVLIVCSYDTILESIFQEHGKPYVVLSSIINRAEGYDIGHILVSYSDNPEVERTYLAEELSKLKLMEAGYTLIYKIKGTCSAQADNPTSSLQKNALLLSESNFFTFARYADKIIPAYLVKHFQDRSFMFIGFNPKIWEERLLVNALIEKRRFIADACYTASTSTDPLEAAYWKKQKVEQYDIQLRQLDESLAQVLEL